VTNTGFTTVVGDVGLTPGSSVTGSPRNDHGGHGVEPHINDTAAVAAQAAWAWHITTQPD